MKKRFWKFILAVLAAYALQGAELGNKDKAHVESSVRRVDLLAGRTLADFDCLLTDDKAAIARAYSISGGVMRVSGESRAFLVTKETYRDFDLSFDMSYPEEGFGDGGIMLWVRSLPDRPDIYTGMEIQTKTGYLGDLWGLARFRLSQDASTPVPEGHIDSNTKERYRRIPRISDVTYVPGQWLHVDFRRRGLDCELYIEGKLVNRCTVMDTEGGRIGFQTRPYPEGKAPILYRNMILTPHDEEGKSCLADEDKAYGELHGRIAGRFRLWPGLAPHETEADPGRYAYDERVKVWRRRDVSCPEVVVLRPENPVRDTLVVVMQGGGYSSQHMGHLCRDSLPILGSGRWVAVLHYRIPRRDGRKIYDAPREDAARAIRILRANAAKFGWSPEKIGAVGFSAGAHLAAISAVSSQDPLYGRIDEIDDISPHLNFSVPVYPAYIVEDGATGPNKNRGDGASILQEFKFDSKTPPMFLVHGDRDYYSPMGSIRIYEELHRRKMPAQLFIYANASHGLGDAVNVCGWQNRIVDWIASIGF